MKQFSRHVFFLILAFFTAISLVWADSAKTYVTNMTIKTVPVPVTVKVTVKNENWVETISICNISSNTIPLTNVEFDFNYAATMPTNIWGNPWAAWILASQTGTSVILKGGTPYTPPLLPDPNCNSPLSIQFNASPTLPAPNGPFVFKAEGAQPTQGGGLNINMPDSPAANLPVPNVTVSGPNFNQSKAVNWASTWQLTNLTPGSYQISASPVNNGTDFYKSTSVTVNVESGKTVNQTIAYQAVASGTVTVTLIQAPNTQESITFTGSAYTLTKTVSSGNSVTLPADTYSVSSIEPGYTVQVNPNPLVVPNNTALSITYTKVDTNPSAGPYTTQNGQIVDKNNLPVTFKGVNWFGFNTGNHIVHGLWTADFNVMLNQIKAVGFNAVRLPFAFDFILDPTIKPNGITNYCGGKPCNQNVPTDSAVNAFKWVVKQFTDNGLYVLLDDHYEDNTYVSNYSQWLAGWNKVVQMFIDNPMVGYDLYNEPDSHNLTWEGSASGTPWATGVESAANAIYALDQRKLIFIEGVAQGALESNWGDGFATDNATVSQGISNPKNLFTRFATKAYVNQIVVSPHMYGPDGTNNQGPDHSDQTKAYAAWSRLHGYLYNNFLNINNTSQSGFCVAGTCHLYPIAVGEFGGKFDPADPYYQKDVATNINIATYINRLGNGKPALPSWFYWDWNPNSGNTGGILKDDWTTIDCNKVNYLRTYLALQPAAGICPVKK